MLEALGWGLLAGSSLLVGGVLALTLPIGRRPLGLVMAFGGGVLMSAVAYELVEEAFRTSTGSGGVALGLLAGSATFFAGDSLISRMGGGRRKHSGGDQAGGSGLAIVLGIVLDGIPESIVLGLSLLTGQGVGVAVIFAIFLSNLPEAIAASTGLSIAGWRRAPILGLWLGLTAVTALASLAGFALFGGASPATVAFTLAFGGGAILTMLADTMMPEAFENGGRLVGVFTTMGFAVAFGVSTLE